MPPVGFYFVFFILFYSLGIQLYLFLCFDFLRFAFMSLFTTQTQTSMPPVGFKPATPAIHRPQTFALDRSATGIGKIPVIPLGTRTRDFLFCGAEDQAIAPPLALRFEPSLPTRARPQTNALDLAAAGIDLVRTVTLFFSPCLFIDVVFYRRLKLEYVSVIRNSITSTDANQLERIQRKLGALCYNSDFPHASCTYAYALQYLKLLPYGHLLFRQLVLTIRTASQSCLELTDVTILIKWQSV
jgi:hypothetical protein